LYKSAEDGREIVIKLIQPGEIFAEVILFEEEYYPVSAVALSPCRLLRLPKVQIQCLLAKESFRHDFIAMLMRKQRYLAHRILELSAHDVEERFFGFLRDQYGEQKEYRITLSKKDIAAAIGTIPETFSRLLLKLKENGELTWKKDVVTLRPGFWKDWDAL
jgi:CRP/FNR family transcriptional regulator